MEGIRVLVEVIVWSCCSDESEICEWINEVTLKKLMAGFHSLLLRLAGLKQDELDDETVSAVVHRIACVFGGLLFVPGMNSLLFVCTPIALFEKEKRVITNPFSVDTCACSAKRKKNLLHRFGKIRNGHVF